MHDLVFRSLTKYHNRNYDFCIEERIVKFCDMHVHTASSPDAEIPASELVRMAPEFSVGTVGFVAHVDFHPSDYCYNGFSESDYMQELDLAESSGVRILRGIEIGEPHLYMEKAESIFTAERYDFITGALHWTEDGLILAEKPFLQKNAFEIVEKYYTETLKIVRQSPINILAHMGIFRRGMSRAGLVSDFDETLLFPSLMQEILQTMIRKGIALEVNTSGLRRPEKSTYPSSSVLQLYYKLGGRMVTVGSDTHRSEHAFFGLEFGHSLLKSCEFDNYGYFLKGEYVNTPLLCN